MPQEPKNDLRHISPAFIDCLQSRFEALSTNDQMPDKLWNDTKDIIHEESERSL